MHLYVTENGEGGREESWRTLPGCVYMTSERLVVGPLLK